MTMPFDWRQLLDEEPEAAYFAQQPRWGQGQKQQDYWSGRFGKLHDQYLGALGRQLQQGLTPDLTANQFFQDYDFQGKYNALAPSQRGDSQRQFAPFASFLGWQ